MDIIIICFIICFLILWIFCFVVFKTCRTEFAMGSVLMGIIIAYVFCLIDVSKPSELDVSKPSALDVYRGKTTLEITSVNGIPKDTVVVYKK